MLIYAFWCTCRGHPLIVRTKEGEEKLLWTIVVKCLTQAADYYNRLVPHIAGWRRGGKMKSLWRCTQSLSNCERVETLTKCRSRIVFAKRAYVVSWYCEFHSSTLRLLGIAIEAGNIFQANNYKVFKDLADEVQKQHGKTRSHFVSSAEYLNFLDKLAEERWSFEKLPDS